MSFDSVELWTPRESIPASESWQKRKVRLVNSIPPAIRERARSISSGPVTSVHGPKGETIIPPDARLRKLVADWLEALTLEQMETEKLARGFVTADVGPGGKCSPGRHACGLAPPGGRPTLAVGMRTDHRLASIPLAWRPLAFMCGACFKSAADLFLIERDVDAGKWLRITNAAPVALVVALDGAARVLLEPCQTAEIDNVERFIADPHTFPVRVTDRHRPTSGRLAGLPVPVTDAPSESFLPPPPDREPEP